MSFLDSLFGGGSTSSTQTTSVDPNTAAYMDWGRQMAMGRAGWGASPYMTNASRGYGQMMGNLGFGMGTGLAGLESYYDPYQGEVIGGINADYDRMQQMAMKAAADEATRAGAFGGSRGAVLQAQSMRDLNDQRAMSLGNARSQGYWGSLNAMMADRARALQAGQAGAAGLAGLGGLDITNRWAGMNAMTPWMRPTSETMNMTQQTSSSPFSQLLGGALSIGSMFMNPFGGAAGAPWK